MFVVTKRFGRIETRVSEFKQYNEAERFILEKLREDIQFKLMATYCLYEGADILREFTQADAEADAESGTSSDSSGSEGGKGTGKSFAPTPFSTSPRLGPQTWIKDDNKDEEDK